jgi:hypothetical protein
MRRSIFFWPGRSGCRTTAWDSSSGSGSRSTIHPALRAVPAVNSQSRHVRPARKPFATTMSTVASMDTFTESSLKVNSPLDGKPDDLIWLTTIPRHRGVSSGIVVGSSTQAPRGIQRETSLAAPAGRQGSAGAQVPFLPAPRSLRSVPKPGIQSSRPRPRQNSVRRLGCPIPGRCPRRRIRR